MTDVVQDGTEWVPRFGMLEVPRERAELIRGLFELAAFVADHPELPLPFVTAGLYPNAESFDDEVVTVDLVADALGVVADLNVSRGHYVARKNFGPVQVSAMAVTRESSAAFQAHMSYRSNVQPVEGVAAGESR
jgi:hypothetical protein